MTIFTLFNPRRISNSRMRLAKGFFLPFIAAGMRSKFCRPASGGRRADVRWTSGGRPAEVLRETFYRYKFLFHPSAHPRTHSTNHPTRTKRGLFYKKNHSSSHSLTHAFFQFLSNKSHFYSIISNSLFEPPTRSSNQSINHLLILTVNLFLSINQSTTHLPNHLPD